MIRKIGTHKCPLLRPQGHLFWFLNARSNMTAQIVSKLIEYWTALGHFKTGLA